MTNVSRREFLVGASAVAAGLAIDQLPGLPGLALPRRTHPTPGRLSDIDHVVIMIQENRSFDHYFGTFPGVRGFGDRHVRKTAFAPRDMHRRVHHPFHIDTAHTGGGCTTDPDHTWFGQHRSVGNGAMDGWLKGPEATVAPVAMGYFSGADIPYYFALAKAFTICDHYFCSAMGATDPNRAYAMTGTIDPAGTAGGPVLNAGMPGQRPPSYTWTTMPEQLEAHGVSWKIYSAPDSTNVDGDNTVIFFSQYHSNATLTAKALTPTFDDFVKDAQAGNLPQVSWVISPVNILEHPLQSTPQAGEVAVRRVINAITARRDAWRKTALFLTWDENGGFFDHVPPPRPPLGTPDEFITVRPLPPEASGIGGPIGLGPRVPMLVVSPFSRGGFVSSETFDHTSLLRFLETRFGVEVPNLSQWRRATCGDLTTALNFAAPNPSVPRLPKLARVTAPTKAVCSPILTKYPRTSGVPHQAAGKPRRPSGLPRSAR